jgi:ribosomal-protein-alanine N-acetyltransferase
MLLKEMTPEFWLNALSIMPDEELVEFMGFNSPEELALEKEKAAAGMSTYYISFRHFVIIEKQSGTTLGRAGYHTWFPLHSRAEIGYAIHQDENKSKGYMKEALKAILQYGFEQMDLHRVEALIGPTNTPSIRLAEGLGFTKEGHLRDHYHKNGNIQDSLFYAMLKPEYEVVRERW